MHRKNVIDTLFCVVAYLCLIVSVSRSDLVKPHIVTIVADDLGWNDVGFHGSNQIPTPNIDALAYNGVILNRHYTMPTCTPSRTAFLTGTYPIRTGMQGYPMRAGEPRGIPLSWSLLPQRLRALGYTSRMVGKWHVGYHRSEFTPTRRGFQSHLGFWNGYIGYFDQISGRNNLTGFDMHRNFEPAWDLKGQYVTEVLTREAVRLISEHDTSQPLYLHLAHLAVHTGNSSTPLEVPDPKENNVTFGYITDPKRRLYAGMVAELDKSVGHVVSALADRGMLNNSIILFISDNGAQNIGPFANMGSNYPLRGVKVTLFEGGVRCVAAVWSSLLQSPGRVSKNLVHISDWLPTLYSAAGGNVSDLGTRDGIDQWTSLVNGGKGPRTKALINVDTVSEIGAIIDGKWKYVKGSFEGGPYDDYYGDNGSHVGVPEYDTQRIIQSPVAKAISSLPHINPIQDETIIKQLRGEATVTCNEIVTVNLEHPPYVSTCLFDLESDPCEMNNVIREHDTVVKVLTKALDEFRNQSVPQLNQPVDPKSDPARYNGTWTPWLDYDTDANYAIVVQLSVLTAFICGSSLARHIF